MADFLAAVAVQAAAVGKEQRQAVVVVPQVAEVGMEPEVVEHTAAGQAADSSEERLAEYLDVPPSMQSSC